MKPDIPLVTAGAGEAGQPVLVDRDDIPGFAAYIGQTCQRAGLFIDFDGTLIETAPTPDSIIVPRDLSALLVRLQRWSGERLAILSGRSLSDIDRRLSPLVLAGCGQYGAELRFADETVSQSCSSSDLDACRHLLASWSALNPEVLIEDKGLSIAFHTRAAPHAHSRVVRFVEDLCAIAGPGWVNHQGKGSIEMGRDDARKDIAVQSLLDSAPFAGCTPVYFGDDATDEACFAQVNAAGGMSIHVGSRAGTCARWAFASPACLREFLTHLADDAGQIPDAVP
jgi:trehalose 6-phosphate phosphatase